MTHVQRAIETTGGSSVLFPETSSLLNGLRLFPEELIRTAKIIEEESCIRQAIQRLVAQSRPSQTGEVKDSIHLEHYLELARQLQNVGFPHPCIFVSSNSADYWEDKSHPRVHPDLKSVFDAAALQFEPKIENALGKLGLR